MNSRTIQKLATAIVLVAMIGSATTAFAAPKRSTARTTRVPRVSAVAVVPLTATETADLQYLREEEKLARDVYTVLYEKWGLSVFSTIAASEQRHTDSIRKLLVKYGVSDPAASTAPGEFVNDELQALYDELVARGSVSLADAIDVGVLIEEIDIADLEERIATTSRKDIVRVYSNLLSGSENHLAAFTSLQ